MKKLNIAILTLLLVFQTVLSPISVLAVDVPDNNPEIDGATNTNNSGQTQNDQAVPSTGESELSEHAAEKPEGNNSEEGTVPPAVEKPKMAATAPTQEMNESTDTTEGEQAEPLDLTNEVSMEFVKLMVGDTEVVTGNEVYNAPAKGDSTSIHYAFKLGALTKDYGVGSSFKFNLPTALLVFDSKSLSGTGQLADGKVNFEYVVNSTTKEVTVTFLDELEEAAQYSMNMKFNAAFGNFENENNLEQKLEIPIKGKEDISLSLTFKPKTSGEKITKTGTVQRDADGTAYINWEVWVNKAGLILKDAKFLDDLGEGHELSGDISVATYEMGINGYVESPNPTTNTFTQFPISLGDTQKAYKITYKTKVTREPDSEKETFKNTAKVITTNNQNSQVSKEVDIAYGTPLAKKHISGDKYNSKWEIQYNYLGASIAKGEAKITDTLSNLHKYDQTSFEVYKVTLDATGKEASASKMGASEYEITFTNDNEFVIDFSESAVGDTVKSAFKVVYNTIAKPEFITSETLKNYGSEVGNTIKSTNTDKDKNPYEAKAGFTAGQGIFAKSAPSVDYANKTLTWTLEINAEKTLKNVNLKDVFSTVNKENENLGHTLVEWETGTNKYFDVSSTPSVDYKEVNRTASGFEWTFAEIPAGTNVTIKYKTKFTINPDGTVATSYKNDAQFKWNGELTTENTEKGNAEYKPKPDSPTVNNGYKDGMFDHETQQFTWGIGININKQDINGATLTDKLGVGHHIVVPSGATLQDQITVKRLDLSHGEKGEIKEELARDKWTVEKTAGTDYEVTGYKITFASDLTTEQNNQAYYIEYKTKDADEVLGQKDAPNNKYTNSATLKTINNKEYTYTKDVDIKNANELIGKYAYADGDAETITWTVDVNKSHSQLGNITLTDKPSSNQKLLKDTFRIREIKMNTNGDISYGDWSNISASEVKDADEGAFTLDLGNIDQKGYQVEYKTFFLGANDDTYSNAASINYEGASSANTGNSTKENGKFSYNDSSAEISSVKGSLKLHKVKVNPATGKTEDFDGITFELYNKNGTIKLDEATSDTNGIVLFEDVRYGKYLIKEKGTPEGYKVLAPFNIVMGEANDVKLPEKSDVVRVVENIENINTCKEFTLTLKDIDGDLIKSKEITLKDEKGNEIHKGYTDTEGNLRVPNTVKGGEYSVFEGAYFLEKIIVNYTPGDCQDKLQPKPSCPQFTITLKDKDDKLSPNKAVTLKDKSGNVITSTKTDENGKFTVETTTPAGKYNLYEGNQFLSEVTISYKNSNCGTEVTQAPTCETFKLTVKDVDGEIRAGVDIIIKEKVPNAPGTGKTIETGTTDKNGKFITTKPLVPGEYEVFEGSEKLDEFVVNIDCEATIQPNPKCDFFTITVKDQNGVVRPNVKVTVKADDGTIIAKDVVTDKDGKITLSNNTKPGKYTVHEGDLFLGEIEVSYKNDCNAEIKSAPTCPNFILSIQDAYGKPRPNVDVTVKDAANNAVVVGGKDTFTTDLLGSVEFLNVINPGTYKVYEGTKLIGSFTVKDTCKAIVKPSSGGGGGGWVPPIDPENPDPKPEPPVDPEKPDPKPEPPVDPEKPDPKPEPPVDPGKPDPKPEPPVVPGKPDPDKPSTGDGTTTPPTKPGKPTVDEVIDIGKKLPPKTSTTTNQTTLDKYKDFLNKYSKLSKEDQLLVGKTIDINKVKVAIDEMEDLLAKGKLPQTDGADQTGLKLAGLLLVIGAIFFLRRRNADVK